MFENAYAISSYRRKHKNIRAISRAHSLDIYFERAKNNYLPLKLITSKKLDLISFVSKQGERYWCDFLNTSNMLKRAKTISSQLGVTHNYEIHINSLSSQREFVVLTNCWLQPLKRIDLFIEALSNIDGINIKWYHIGDDYGTGYFDTIKQTCNKYLNTKTNISHDFLGRLEYENVLKFYNDTTVDLFVSTSSTEGVPVSMMEAISFGVPIIATDVGGVSEVVINKQNGYLLSPNPTAKEVSSKIVEFYNLSESERLLLRKNAQSLWKEKYDATKNYPKFIDEMLIL
jgi:glycosyltransferase involved in cell wall biosynthesis